VHQFSEDSRFASTDVFTQGIKVDDIRGRVYYAIANISIVLGTPPTPGRLQSGFVEADLFTGATIRFVDFSNLVSLPNIVSANDVIRDLNGNFILTDLLGRLLKVDSHGRVEVFSEDPQLRRVSLSGVNGIVLLDVDHILVGNYDLNTISKVHMPTRRVTNVPIVNGVISSPDGVVMGPDGDLYVAQNVQGANQTLIARLRSPDNWETCLKIGEAASIQGGGTAVIFRGNAPYVTHSSYPPPNSGVLDRVHFNN